MHITPLVLATYIWRLKMQAKILFGIDLLDVPPPKKPPESPKTDVVEINVHVDVDVDANRSTTVLYDKKGKKRG